MSSSTLTLRNLSSTPLKVTRTEHTPPPPPPRSLVRTFTTLFTSSPAPKIITLDDEPPSQNHADITVLPFETCATGIKLHFEGRGGGDLRVFFETCGEGAVVKFYVDVPESRSCKKSLKVTRVSSGGKEEEEEERLVIVEGEGAAAAHGDHKYSALYHGSSTHLCLFSTGDLSTWQSHLPDNTSLQSLSIPGTHNSPTCHRALPSVRCQTVPIPQQLSNGIRFFDLRVQPSCPPPSTPSASNGTTAPAASAAAAAAASLILVHGVFPITLTVWPSKALSSLLQQTYEFLKTHPSETVIVSLKREGSSTCTDQQFSKLIKQQIVDVAEEMWYTSSKIPTLGEARGKCVLLRRFKLDPMTFPGPGSGEGEEGGAAAVAVAGEWGINASTWVYNTPHALTPSGSICVQDFCEATSLKSIEQKITYVKEHLERTSSSSSSPHQETIGDERPLSLNFLSASNFWKFSCWPERIARKVNPVVLEYLAISHCAPPAAAGGVGVGGRRRKEGGTTGVVVCDFIGEGGEWDLCKIVVAWNGVLVLQ